MTPVMRGKVKAALERGDRIDGICKRFGVQRDDVLKLAMELVRQKRRDGDAPA